MEYLKRDDESNYEYIIRLIEGKSNGIYDIDYNELFRLAFGVELNSDECRKRYYGLKMLLPYLDKDKIKNITDDEILKEYELKKQELFKEQVKFFDQRRELNDVLRKQSREDYLYTLIDDSIKNSNLEQFEYIRNNINQTDNDMLVFLTDIHYGIECDNYWNRYNPQIFVQYLKKYLDEIINIKQLHNSENCYIFLGGDLISGLIHNLIRVENTENVVEQVQHVSEYISNFVNELSKEFNNIFIHNVAGNHSRLMQNKKEAIKDEKLDLLIPWYIKSRLSNLENVFVIDNDIDKTIASIYIREKLYLGVHGDMDSPAKVVNSLTQMLDIKPYAVLIAHRHHYSIESEHNVKVISSGSFVSVDEYCISNRISGKASQTVCICDKNGVRCSYDVGFN